MDDVVLGGNKPEISRMDGISRSEKWARRVMTRHRSRSDRTGGHGCSVRTIASLVVLFLIATLCPLLASSSTPAAAAERPSIEVLPANFAPSKLNNKGEVVGTVSQNNTVVTAVYADGELEILPGGPVWSILSFNDDGEMLVTVRTPENRLILQLRDRSGIVKVFETPTNDGVERGIAAGWGPADNGTVLASIGWATRWNGTTFNGNGLLYQPAGGYDLVTSLSTVLAMTKTGSIFGFQHGGNWQNPLYAMANPDGSVTSLAGIGRVSSIRSMTDSGRILYYGLDGYFILEDGVATKVNEPQQPSAINDKGVIAGTNSGPNGSQATLRFEDGTLQSLAEITNANAQDWNQLYSANAMNENCDVLGDGSIRVGTGFSSRSYLAHVPDCEVKSFEGGFARPDIGVTTVYLGEKAQVRLRVANISDEDITNVEVVDADFRETALGGSVEITETANELPQTLAASGLDSQGFVWFDVEGIETGSVWLVANVRGTRNGKTVTGTLETLFAVKGGLALTVEQENAVVFGADNNDDGEIDEEDEIVQLNVKVQNTTEETITNIGPLDLTRPLKFTSRIADLGVMLEPVELPSEPIAQLAAGASQTLVYKYRATDKVSADIEAIFRGMQDGREVSGVGRGQVNVGSEIWARVSMRVEERPYLSGQTIRLFGKIENVSEVKDDAGNITQEGRPIGVMIEPVAAGNAGGGHVFDMANAGGRTPTSSTAFHLAVGESLDVGAILATLETDQPSQAEIQYKVTVWDHDVEPDEDPIRGDDTNVEWVRDGTSSDSHTVPLTKVTYPGAQPFLNCPGDLPNMDYVSCRFAKGAFSFVQGSWDLANITVYGTGQFFRGYWGVMSTMVWAQQQMVEFMLGDPEALQRLADEIVIDLKALQDVGVESLKGLTITAQGVVPALANALHDMDQVLHRGDMRAIVGGMAEFGGSNIDSLLGFGLLVRSRAAAKSLAGAAGVDGAAREAMEAAGRKQASELESRVTDALSRGKSLPKGGVLKAGDDVTNMAHVHRAFGATERDVTNLLKISIDEDVILPFRSRSVRAGQMIESGQALPKPGSVPIKTVNEIDEFYLRYKPEWNSQAVLVEPPVPWKAAGSERDALVEAYLDSFAELTRSDNASRDLRNIVRDRLETRLDEWPKQLELFSQYADNGIDINFYSGKNGLSDRLMPNNQPNMAAKIIADPISATGQSSARAAFRLEMADPTTGQFKAIVGDIDFLGIFNRDGSPVTDIAKRLRIYKKMRSLLGMQHGESFTFTVENLRQKFLSCCTAAGETMLAPTPDGKLIATNFDDALTVLTAGPNAAVTNNTTLPLFSFGRLISEYESQLTGTKGAQLPTLTEYLTDFVKGKLPSPPQSPKDIRDLLVGLEKKVRPNDNFNRTEGEPLRANREGQLERYNGGDGTIKTGPKPLRAVMAQGGGPATTVQEALTQLIAQGYDAPDLGVGAQGGIWEAVDPNEILGSSDQFQILPFTYIGDPAEPGDTTIDVLTPTQLRMSASSPFLMKGDKIVIDPGGQHEETATIASVGDGKITLTAPLTRTHASATMVILPTATAAGNNGNGNGTNNGGTNGTNGSGTDATRTDRAGHRRTDGTGVNSSNDGRNSGASGTTGRPGRLPYTGGNSLLLGLFGAAMLGAGLVIMETRRQRLRRRRRTS